MKGISTGYLDDLWRQAIIKTWGKCAICGGKDDLQAHHIIRRAHGITRFDPDNGICVCVALRGKMTCHELVHTRLGERTVGKLLGEKYEKLCKLEHKVLNDYLFENEMTRNEYRLKCRERLKKIIKGE